MKKIYLTCWLALFALVCLPAVLMGQDYPTNAQITQRLNALKSKYPNLTDLKSLTKTTGGKDIWVLRLGKGDADNKSAIAVVGGVEGFHLLGVEMSLRFAESVLANNADVLDEATFYIFPNMSPDAYEQYFAALKYERRGNATPTDDDRDGSVNEDGFDDLNKDGVITLMRVKDATGPYIMHEADERIMIMANKDKGEAGQYLVTSEGVDQDKDGHFNEDGEGGVAFNKSFSYQFPYFTPGSGEFPVSQVEQRAMLDFMYERFNIHTIFTFGPGNNLSSPWKYNAQGARVRVVTSVLSDDAKLNALLSEQYNKTISQKNAPSNPGTDGDFLQWAYFHFGKLSLGTPGWWVPTVKEAEGEKANADKNEEVNFLRWAAQEDINDVFVPWTAVQHPDFPGKTVEVGGIKPFVKYNPPFAMIDGAAAEHNAYLVSLAKMLPSLEWVDIKQESLGNGLTRVTAKLRNKGQLPTHTEMGKRSRWLRKVRVDMMLNDKQSFIAGQGMTLIDAIEGNGFVEMSWVVRGAGKVNLKGGAAHTGFATAELTIK